MPVEQQWNRFSPDRRFPWFGISAKPIHSAIQVEISMDKRLILPMLWRLRLLTLLKQLLFSKTLLEKPHLPTKLRLLPTLLITTTSAMRTFRIFSTSGNAAPCVISGQTCFGAYWFRRKKN